MTEYKFTLCNISNKYHPELIDETLNYKDSLIKFWIELTRGRFTSNKFGSNPSQLMSPNKWSISQPTTSTPFQVSTILQSVKMYVQINDDI